MLCRSHVNVGIKQPFSDSSNKAAKSTGHCALDSKHATLMENACGWQPHHLAYQEQFLGNDEDKLVKVLQRAQGAVTQSMNILRNYLVPASLFMSTRLEVGRRDSYIDRMNK